MSLDLEQIKKESTTNTIVQTQDKPKFNENLFQKSVFAEKMEDVKVNVLNEASIEDKKFVDTIKSNLKKTATKITEVEHEKAAYEEQQIKSESEKLSREQAKNKQGMSEDKWANREKLRQYVYNGVKPVMTFVGIDEPMSVVLTVFLTFVLIIPFLLAKLWNGTIGLLIVGASDKDRSKAMKGMLWTILVLIVLGLLFIGIYLFLKSQGIDILLKLK